ncbi:MAG TPA: MerR family transcriptional regulator [Clostridia bacterium]|nr:MerR family transcriptional regulator [Clostridia bacterium]
MNLEQDMPIYSIGAAAKITSLTPRQIRYYEQQGLIQPARTKGNQRIYSKSELERLKLIKFLLQQGIKLNLLKDNIDKLEEMGKKYKKNSSFETKQQINFEKKEIDLDLAQFFRKEESASLYPVRNQEEIWRNLISKEV